MRLWIWRLVLLGLAVVAGFFAVTLVLPLSTMGDPTYDTAMLRTRWWAGLYLPLVQLAAVLVLAGLWLRGAKGWIGLALLCSVAGLGVMMFEEISIIQYGDLRGTPDAAALRLAISRWATFGLTLVALVAGLMAVRRELDAG